MNRTNILARMLGRHVKNFALRGALLMALVIVPAAVYAAQVTGLTTFVNGEIADADQVNANFTSLTTAINDNDTRITVVESLLGASCPAGQFIAAISAGGSLTCAVP